MEWGKILLPPDVFLVFRSHRWYHVVEVHNDVYETVEQRKESTVTAYEMKKKKQNIIYITCMDGQDNTYIADKLYYIINHYNII